RRDKSELAVCFVGKYTASRLFSCLERCVYNTWLLHFLVTMGDEQCHAKCDRNDTDRSSPPYIGAGVGKPTGRVVLVSNLVSTRGVIIAVLVSSTWISRVGVTGIVFIPGIWVCIV